MKRFAFILAPLMAISFLTNCNNGSKPAGVTHWYEANDWWNYCSNGVTGEQAVAEDIGKEANLTVNGQVHKVRLIDIDHDVLSDDTTKKAHCTFEFSNLLSDSSGYSLATLWNTKDGDGSTNYDYENSDLRTALDGIINRALRWYQKGLGEYSKTTYTKPVIDMLPEEVRNNIKTVKKEVATTSLYNVTNYDAKVFALTHNEMTKSGSSATRAEGTTYQYYKDHDDDSSRIKYQVKWHDGAATSFKEITDFNWHPSNYAGYNSSIDSGGYYWIASPGIDGNSVALRAGGNGKLIGDSIYSVAYAVAPAFCI